MLELKNITKVYPAGGEHVSALKGISLRFRENEFVSILGPSGCGKTTMLNIIGGLDQYTTGDLVINGKSTKDFVDRDWDAYRNHSIGFVFQSYNLIPHQTVLQNVELALTLSGVSKSERRIRAITALKKVGLGDQLRKRPSEMSGGQMQRVAIARAIVNNPDIILADEPTGALDTETSIQVMDILKEISQDRLVIMVTHNPDLAERYSTRIIKMLDGNIIDDNSPLSDEEVTRAAEKDAEAVKSGKKEKKPSMSFFTSFGLSLKNLFTKKGRTALTSFAGSIGIIGIALIYAVSQGTTNYINAVQEETLSSYPITLESEHIDVGTLLRTFVGKAESIKPHENDAIYQKAMLYEMMNSLNTIEEQENDLKSFKSYLERERRDEESPLYEALSGVQYTYDVNLLVYTKNIDGEIIRSDTQRLISDLITERMGINYASMAGSASGLSSMGVSSSMVSQGSNMWQELLPGNNGELISDLVQKQYDLVYGNWPSDYNEIVLFVDSRNELNDLTLYALGLKSKDDIVAIMDAAAKQEEIEYEIHSWSYEDICNMDFRTILSSECFTLDEKTGNYTDLRETDTGLKYLYDNGLKLKVCGIARPAEHSVSNMVTGSIGYTSALIEHIITSAQNSDAVKAQKETPDIDIISGLPFKGETELSVSEKAENFRSFVSELEDEKKSELYISMMSVPSDEMVEQYVQMAISQMTRADMEKLMLNAMTEQMGMDAATVGGYISAMSDEEITETFTQSMKEQYIAQYAAGVAEQMASMTSDQLTAALEMQLEAASDEQCADYYDKFVEFSRSTYDDNLIRLGCLDLDSPSSINLFASTFASKDNIEEVITAYNDTVDDLSEIHYTDYIGIMMSSITTIINAITYVLIAFVAVSLVVSSIMIGVITLISVQERTKEIGILRAIGASKKNVSSMFNAETVIIGFTSGTLGVIITWLLCIPINLILHKLTGIGNLSAVLPIGVAVILVIISMLLTLIAGIIPSRSAAKKDPVVALRTE